MLKFYILKGDYLERIRDIKKGHVVAEKGLFVVVADSEDREAFRHYIPRQSVIQVNDSDMIDSKSVISEPANEEKLVVAEWDPYSTPTIAEVAGVVSYEDIEPGYSAAEQYDEATGQSRLVINEYLPSGIKPTIIS